MTEKIMNCYQLSPELTLMLSLALRDNSPYIPEDLDWEKFDTLVSKNRIEPLVAEGIKKLPTETVQKNAILQKLLSSQNGYALLCMRQMGTLAMLIKTFEDNGIRALSLKGPILAMELYGNPALRYSRDLDILVHEDDLETACECLKELGYTEEITVRNKTPLRRRKLEEDGEEMHRVYIKDDICIELHWRLSFRVDESFDDLWEHSRTKVLLGQEIHYPGEYDNISYLISHAAGHGYQRLRWLIDIYELKKNTDLFFAAVYRYMTEQNVGMLMLETVLVLYLIPSFSMPQCSNNYFSIQRENNKVIVHYEDAIKKDFRKAYRLAMAAYPILINDTVENGIAGRKYNHLLPTLGRKKTIIRSVMAVLEPSKADLELIDLPDSLYFLYYIIRPFHKIWCMMPFSRKRP